MKLYYSCNIYTQVCKQFAWGLEGLSFKRFEVGGNDVPEIYHSSPEQMRNCINFTLQDNERINGVDVYDNLNDPNQLTIKDIAFHTNIQSYSPFYNSPSDVNLMKYSARGKNLRGFVGRKHAGIDALGLIFEDC